MMRLHNCTVYIFSHRHANSREKTELLYIDFNAMYVLCTVPPLSRLHLTVFGLVGSSLVGSPSPAQLVSFSLTYRLLNSWSGRVPPVRSSLLGSSALRLHIVSSSVTPF
jgi:hypothetical protein